MTTDFGDDGDAYVKGENAEPINWDEVSRLEALFQEVLADDDSDGRLTRAKALLDEMYGD
jgi:hypothetical protein